MRGFQNIEKLNSHGGFLSYLQNSTADSAHLAVHLHCLSLPSKSHRENSISSILLESPHQVDMKNDVKSSIHFFGYFNTLEGYDYKVKDKYHLHEFQNFNFLS